MSRNCVLLAGVLLLGSAEMSLAAPLDSPDIVYIDGQPCNSLCQSYMAWSRQVTSQTPRTASIPAPKAVTRRVAGTAKAAAHIRTVKQVIPTPEQRPRTMVADAPPAATKAAAAPEVKATKTGDVKTADSKAADVKTADAPSASSATVSEPAKAADSQAAANVADTSAPAPAKTEDAPPATGAAPDSAPAKMAALQPPAAAAANSGAAPDGVGDRDAAGSAAAPSTMTPQQQVIAAMAVAEHVTAAAVSAPKPAGDQPDTTASVTTGKEAAAPADKTDLLVAVVLAHADVKSVSELAGKNIATDESGSASSGDVRTAIAAAGATAVQLSEGQGKPLDRLIGGEVPAAVLALVSPEAAEGFPDIAGFKVFRIPLSPRSLKAGMQTP